MVPFAIDDNEAEQGVHVSSSNSEFPAQPSQPSHPSQPSQPSQTPPSTIAREATVADISSPHILVEEKIRYRHMVDSYTLGWPRFAATQVARHNGSLYRRFAYLISRVLLYRQGRLDNLQQQLEEHENRPTTDPRSLSAGQTRIVGEEGAPDRLDLIMTEITKELTEQCFVLDFKWRTLYIASIDTNTDDDMAAVDLLIRDRDTQALIAAYTTEVKELYQHVANQDMVEDSGFHPVYELSDFVYTRPKLVHNGLRGFISGGIGERLFRPIFGGRQLSSTSFMRILQVLVVIFGALMLLFPTGVMYLSSLSKSASYGLVVGLVVVFSTAFVVADATFEHVLVGTCAYVAVLSSILVQTQGNCGVCA